MFVAVVVPEERRLALSVPSLEMMEEFASWVVGTPEAVLREAGLTLEALRLRVERLERVGRLSNEGGASGVTMPSGRPWGKPLLSRFRLRFFSSRVEGEVPRSSATRSARLRSSLARCTGLKCPKSMSSGCSSE